jgi:hypothetical protein
MASMGCRKESDRVKDRIVGCGCLWLVKLYLREISYILNSSWMLIADSVTSVWLPKTRCLCIVDLTCWEQLQSIV